VLLFVNISHKIQKYGRTNHYLLPPGLLNTESALLRSLLTFVSYLQHFYTREIICGTQLSCDTVVQNNASLTRTWHRMFQWHERLWCRTAEHVHNGNRMQITTLTEICHKVQEHYSKLYSQCRTAKLLHKYRRHQSLQVTITKTEDMASKKVATSENAYGILITRSIWIPGQTCYKGYLIQTILAGQI